MPNLDFVRTSSIYYTVIADMRVMWQHGCWGSTWTSSTKWNKV